MCVVASTIDWDIRKYIHIHNTYIHTYIAVLYQVGTMKFVGDYSWSDADHAYIFFFTLDLY